MMTMEAVCRESRDDGDECDVRHGAGVDVASIPVHDRVIKLPKVDSVIRRDYFQDWNCDDENYYWQDASVAAVKGQGTDCGYCWRMNYYCCSPWRSCYCCGRRRWRRSLAFWRIFPNFSPCGWLVWLVDDILHGL